MVLLDCANAVSEHGCATLVCGGGGGGFLSGSTFLDDLSFGFAYYFDFIGLIRSQYSLESHPLKAAIAQTEGCLCLVHFYYLKRLKELRT